MYDKRYVCVMFTYIEVTQAECMSLGPYKADVIFAEAVVYVDMHKFCISGVQKV